MFFDGDETKKGVCVAGGGHAALGFVFDLPYDVPETPGRDQANWRFCAKCFALHYGPVGGHCPAGGPHEAQGYDFVLPFGGGDAPGIQARWQFCAACSAMFFAPAGGPCPAGGSHGAQGFDFALPHREDVHRMQFRLRHFLEHESTDGGLNGADDEVYLAALGVDSGAITFGAGGVPNVPTYISPSIGDVTDDAVRGPWAETPFVLVDWDLANTGTDYPRTFTATLLIVEHDNGDLAVAFDKLVDQVGGKLRESVVDAASKGGAAAVGAVVGSSIPGIGTAVGDAVGALAGDGFDIVVDAIRNGLRDDVFTPVALTLEVKEPGSFDGLETEQVVHIRQFGAHYEMGYDWHAVY
jgi:hypothetical protein